MISTNQQRKHHKTIAFILEIYLIFLQSNRIPLPGLFPFLFFFPRIQILLEDRLPEPRILFLYPTSTYLTPFPSNSTLDVRPRFPREQNLPVHFPRQQRCCPSRSSFLVPVLESLRGRRRSNGRHGEHVWYLGAVAEGDFDEAVGSAVCGGGGYVWYV